MRVRERQKETGGGGGGAGEAGEGGREKEGRHRRGIGIDCIYCGLEKRVPVFPSLRRPSSFQKGEVSRSNTWQQKQKVSDGPGEGGRAC